LLLLLLPACLMLLLLLLLCSRSSCRVAFSTAGPKPTQQRLC
jgi:hypothetical protein